ncbi:MAG TPA: lysophospholipid acyltransferase family protein [Acidimicrobiales bacterium]|nr:lysophospholipid acyltransferase family protein [Acidimicrobiales bacterium]
MRAQLLFYRVVRNTLVAFDRVFWRLTVEGKEHVPEGPFILAPVHRSNADTPLVCAVTKRRLRYMGKETVWKYRIPGWILTALGGFPVRRGSADREALRRCVAVLEGGEPLVLFPEGTRRSGPKIQPLYEGAAYLSLRTGVPIVPVGIGGSERAMPKGAKLLRPVKVQIVVGEPLYPSPPGEGKRTSRRAVQELTDRLADELQRLFDDARAKAGD